MRQVVFALCVLFTSLSFAQKKDSIIFDFNNPKELIPAITPAENPGEQVVLNNEVFRNQQKSIFLSFSRRTGSNGVFLTTASEISSYLYIGRGASMIVSAVGVSIDSLVFSKTSKVGSLTLQEPQGIGYIDPSNESWYGRDINTKVTQLVYENMGFDPAIQSFTVFYSSPLDVLVPKEVSPASDTMISSFRQMTFKFAEKVKLGTNPKAVLRGPIELPPYELDLSVIDSTTIVASLKEGVAPITTISDEYTVTLFEHSVVTDDEDGFYNKQLSYPFSIVEAHDLFNVINVFPQEGELSEIPNGIILEFPSQVRYSTNRLKLLNQRTGDDVRELLATRLTDTEYTSEAPFYKSDKDIYCFVKLIFADDLIAPVIADGIYTLKIDEGFFGNTKYKPEEANYRDEGVLYNPEVIITYNVNGVVYPSDEVFQAAQDLLAFTGAGYPAADSPSRLALQSLVDEGVGADALFEAAMDAFYAETVLEMPKSGYYLLSAVGSDGKEVYVGYENGKVSLTSDPEEAAHLLATVNEDGTLVFETPDHKFLKQMMPTGANVSDAKDKMNNLTFSRLVLQDEHGNDIYTPKQLFGLWSINGIIGTNDEEQDITAYTLVNLESLLFETNRDKSLRYFSATQTNAFRLTETDAPVPDATYTFTPAAGSEMESLYYITLTFGDDVNGIKLVSSEGIVLKGTSTRQYTPTKITNTGRQFVFFFDDVAAGTYTLTIPKGAFTYTYNEKTVAVKAISATYRVNNSAVFVEDFLYLHSTYYHNYPNIDTFVRDVDLNNFSMVIYDQGIYGLDTNKAVTITDVAVTQEFARGHLEFDNNFVDQYGTKMTHMVLVMDEPIKYGTLPAQTYCYNIYAGTFGDSNFAEWLKDPQNKRKGDCHVNAYLTPMISVDNDRGNMTFDPQPITSHITKLSDITITFPHFNVVDITDENNIDVLERYTGRTISTSVVRVEGKNNQFTFASDETLTADTNNGGYMIPIPLNFFKAGEYFFPAEREMELFYYAKGGADAIEGVEAAPQTGVIFDLSGRRVTNSSKPGIYIVNGRKVVVK